MHCTTKMAEIYFYSHVSRRKLLLTWGGCLLLVLFFFLFEIEIKEDRRNDNDTWSRMRHRNASIVVYVQPSVRYNRRSPRNRQTYAANRLCNSPPSSRWNIFSLCVSSCTRIKNADELLGKWGCSYNVLRGIIKKVFTGWNNSLGKFNFLRVCKIFTVLKKRKREKKNQSLNLSYKFWISMEREEKIFLINEFVNSIMISINIVVKFFTNFLKFSLMELSNSW